MAESAETVKLKAAKGSTTSDDTGSMTMVQVEDVGRSKRRSRGKTTRRKKNYLHHLWSFLFSLHRSSGYSAWLVFQYKKRKDPLYLYGFDDMFGNKFTAKSYSLEWISDTEYLHVVEGDVYLADLIGDPKLYLSKHTLQAINGTSYKISPDHKFFLIKSNPKKLYRYSTYADYYIHNILTNTSQKLNVPTPGPIRYAGWSTVGNALVYVYINNIYWRKTASGTDYQITVTGKQPKPSDNDDTYYPLYNGIPDWVYEEEVFGTDSAIWFSKDGNFMCYMSFTELNVPYFRWPSYGDITDSYGSYNKIPYPKAGKQNPIVKVYTYNLKNMANDGRTAKELTAPPEVHGGGYYATQVSWVDPNSVSVQWVDRKQTRSVVARYAALNGQQEHRFIEDVQSGWVYEQYPAGYYPLNEDYYLTIMPILQSAINGYFLHIVRVPLVAERRSDVHFVTKGEYEITKFWYNEAKKIVYFISTERGASQRHLYRIGVYGEDEECLTCYLPIYTSGQCKYFDADFSKGTSYYVLYCRGPGIPQTTLHNTETNEVEYLEKNEKLKEVISKTSMPILRNFTIRVEHRIDVQCREILPPSFDEDWDQKYAVLFDVYGGPGSQRVNDKYKMSFSSYLVSNFDIIVVQVDVRGTGFKGEKFKHHVYRKLGEYEALDVILLAGPVFSPSKEQDRLKSNLSGDNDTGSEDVLVSDREEIQEQTFLKDIARANLTVSLLTGKYLPLPLGIEHHAVMKYNKTNALKEVHAKRPYVDPSKLAVWGWSYGGYLTSYILGNMTDVFKCGVAVAPVADWRYYDSIYTERYMGLPTAVDNLAGYERSSVLPYVKNFRNDSFLLVHGTGDDNVHFQNSAQLVRELVDAHISFRVQFYTDKTHGLYGEATRRHLYWLISTFLQDCLTF